MEKDFLLECIDSLAEPQTEGEKESPKEVTTGSKKSAKKVNNKTPV